MKTTLGWLRHRVFFTLMISLILLMIAYPIVRFLVGGYVVYNILLTGVFLAAFRVIFRQNAARVPAVLFGIPTIIGAWTGYVLPDLPRLPTLIGFHVAAAGFLFLSTITIALQVYRQEQLTPDSIFGAFCGYMLLGIAYAHIYCLLEVIIPGSLRAADHFGQQLVNDQGREYVMTYFSFVTLTTVGYGDVTPGNEIVAGFAVVEAVMGQFYIAGFIAELIGKRLQQPTNSSVPG